MADDRPIALFDSGFGGLTVARAVIDLLPDENVVYVGDTGRYPYGPRPQEEVAGFARQITRHLVGEEDAKLVVVACNTAAAAALDELRTTAGVPVVGVIEPGARSLVEATRSRRVGVIGTIGTIGSGAYQRAVAATGATVELTCAACPGFVEFVERDELRSEQVHVLAERLLAPLADADVDTLLLGCTHYPFLARTISDVMGRDVVHGFRTLFPIPLGLAATWTEARDRGIPLETLLPLYTTGPAAVAEDAEVQDEADEPETGESESTV